MRSSRGHPLRFSKRPARETVQDCHRRQIETVNYLLQNHKTLDVAATDIHGNTALHYLACHRDINEALLDLLWNEGGAEEAWRATRNRYGFTAAELFKSGYDVDEEEEKEFWDVIGEQRATRVRKEELWEQILRNADDVLVQRILGRGVG